MIQIFISCATEDLDLGEAIENLLFKQQGIRPYLDKGIPLGGVRKSKKVVNALRNSKWVVVILTENSLKSQWVQQEAGYAYHRGNIITLAEENLVENKKIEGLIEECSHVPFDRNNIPDMLNKIGITLMNRDRSLGERVTCQNCNQKFNALMDIGFRCSHCGEHLRFSYEKR